MSSWNADYAELMALLKERDASQRERKKHRLQLDRYAASDCEFFFTVCARHQGTPFLNHQLAQAIIDALPWRKAHHHWHLYCYCLITCISS